MTDASNMTEAEGLEERLHAIISDQLDYYDHAFLPAEKMVREIINIVQSNRPPVPDAVKELVEAGRQATRLLDSYGPDEEVDDRGFVKARSRLRAALSAFSDEGGGSSRTGHGSTASPKSESEKGH